MPKRTGATARSLTGPTAFAAPTRTQNNAQPPRLHRDGLQADCDLPEAPRRRGGARAGPPLQSCAARPRGMSCRHACACTPHPGGSPTHGVRQHSNGTERYVLVGYSKWVRWCLRLPVIGSLMLCEYSSWVPVLRAPVERVDFVLGLPQKEFRVGDVRFCAESPAGCDRARMPSSGSGSPPCVRMCGGRG
jgi:hypothetical protein